MSNRRDVIAALPELPLEPLELGGTLAHARRGPYVTIVPHERPVPAPPLLPPPPAVSRSTYEIREYFTWVTYPVVHCHSPGELLEGLALHDGTTEAPAAQNDLKAIAGEERHYKLSALNGVRFQSPLFCTVRGGAVGPPSWRKPSRAPTACPTGGNWPCTAFRAWEWCGTASG